MHPTPCRSMTSRLALLSGQFLPSILVCLLVLSVPLIPVLRFTASPETRHMDRQRASIQRLRSLPADSAKDLLDRLESIWNAAGGAVPGAAPRRFPPDLDQLPVSDRKAVFLRSLLPHVLDRNDRIAAERKRLLQLSARIANGAKLQDTERRFLDGLAARYRLGAGAGHPAEQVQVLLRRVDVVPPSIALAQAAIESAWGTSRFARLGNNLFGQWVFNRDRGIAPLQRPDKANYSLARFRSLGDAVDAYLLNLNGFYAYKEFRRLRSQMRSAGDPLDPLRLVAGLTPYSTRGDEYVRDLRSVIRGNALTRYDPARLVLPGDTGFL